MPFKIMTGRNSAVSAYPAHNAGPGYYEYEKTSGFSKISKQMEHVQYVQKNGIDKMGVKLI